MDLGRSAASELPTDERVRRFTPASDPALIALLFQYGRYLLIASSRPGTEPANLQGIWNHHLHPPWSSNYTININTQMNYWPAEVTNLAECHEPLLRFVTELAENGRVTAEVNYGCRGWVAHHNSDLWRQTGQVGAYGEGDPMWACWPMSAPWLCQHLYEHYRFGGDRAYLERVYPVMQSAAEFLLDWLIDDGRGGLTTSPSTSPENKFKTADGEFGVSEGATMDRSLVWDLFRNTLEAARALAASATLEGASSEELFDHFSARLKRALERVAPPAVGRLGQLMEWSRDWDDPEDKHRHVSHLFGLHPGRQITRETPELFAAARRSLELRGDGGTGWSMAWKINFWARLGDGDHALLDAREHAESRRRGRCREGRRRRVPQSLRRSPAVPDRRKFRRDRGPCRDAPPEPHGRRRAPPGASERAFARAASAASALAAASKLDIAWRNGKLERATLRSTLGERCRLRTLG